MRERMHDRRLAVTRDDETLAAIRLEIRDERANPSAGGLRRRDGTGRCDAELRGKRARERFDFGRTQRQAVVRLGAGVGWRAFDGVEAVALGDITLDAAAIRKRSRVPQS